MDNIDQQNRQVKWKAIFVEYEKSNLSQVVFCKQHNLSLAGQVEAPSHLAVKNWIFNGSPAGAKAGAIFFSLIETCKTNNVEPYQYLCAMLNRIRDCVTENDYSNLLPQHIQI